jgi:hypothetical protein
MATLTILAAAWPARAQAPACTPESAGTVACIAGRLCACTGAAAGPARWDCGILRPACGGPLSATLDPYPWPLPDALAIDRSRTTVTTVTGGRGPGDHDGPSHRPKPEHR